MRPPHIAQYSAFLHSPNPNGRKMKMKTNRGKNMRVMIADKSERRISTSEALGSFLVTGTKALQ